MTSVRGRRKNGLFQCTRVAQKATSLFRKAGVSDLQSNWPGRRETIFDQANAIVADCPKWGRPIALLSVHVLPLRFLSIYSICVFNESSISASFELVRQSILIEVGFHEIGKSNSSQSMVKAFNEQSKLESTTKFNKSINIWWASHWVTKTLHVFPLNSINSSLMYKYQCFCMYRLYPMRKGSKL